MAQNSNQYTTSDSSSVEEVLRSGFGAYLGLEVLEEGDGEAVVALDIEDHHLQSRGAVHGGVIASLADAALGAAFRTRAPDGDGSTIDLSIQFIRPISEGQLRAEGTLTYLGNRIYFSRATLKNNGRVVAEAQGTFRRFA